MFENYYNKKGSFFNDSASDLFMNPLDGKISDLIYIADNTFMFSCLMAYMSGSNCASIVPNYDNIMLNVSIQVQYTIFDKWFIFTIVFSVLNALAIGVAVLLYFLQKKKREEYQDFRKRKEKWFINDNTQFGAKIKLQQIGAITEEDT